MPRTYLMCVAALLSTVSQAVAQAANPPVATDTIAPACAGPEFRQFDFWVGEWTVTRPDGEVAGVNRITAILRGCALREEWRGAKGGRGESLNMFDPGARKWRQTWVSEDGVVLLLEGGLVDGRMELSGRRPARQKPGVIRIDRTTWTPLNPGVVQQVWDVSDDDGATWRTIFDGRYTKRVQTGSP